MGSNISSTGIPRSSPFTIQIPMIPFCRSNATVYRCGLYINKGMDGSNPSVALCAIDPHRMNPQHDILWSQVEAWDRGEDVLTLQDKVPVPRGARTGIGNMWGVLAIRLDGLSMASVVVNDQVLVREKSERYSTPQWRICICYWTIGGANGGCFGRTGRYDEVMGNFHTSEIQRRTNGQEVPRLESPPFFLSMLSFLASKLVSHFVWQHPNPCTYITRAFRQLITAYHL